jgi:hypothetical protein
MLQTLGEEADDSECIPLMWIRRKPALATGCDATNESSINKGVAAIPYSRQAM